MKKIVILRCLKAEKNCTGASCLKAFNTKHGAFAQYGDEELELEAFMTCEGCEDGSLHSPEGMQEKIERIERIAPDAIHVGICCQTRTINRQRCKNVLKLIEHFKRKGINIVWGTHSY